MARVYLIYIDINTGYFPGLHHGLASLAGSIRRSGHTLAFYHLSSEESPQDICYKIAKFNADIVGFSITTNQRKYLDKYSFAIRQENNIPQVAGGVHATVAPQDILNNTPSVGGVCIGEGEYSFVDLLNKLDSGGTLYDTVGFWWRSPDGQIRKNPIPKLNPDLSILPFPDYSIFDIKGINERNSGWMDMIVTRGCPYNCFYCCNHVLRSVYPNKEAYVRFAPPKVAIEIIKNNRALYPGIKGITFSDDLLILKKEWFREFIELYTQEIKLPFICNARVEHLTEEICALLKKGNCICARLGVESGNEWFRKNILNRHMTNTQIVGAFGLLKRFKIPSFSYNIVGFPFETKELMLETLRINKRIKPAWGMVYYFYPFPGTEIYSICEKFGLLGNSGSDLSSYLEGPAIKLTHCSLSDCRKVYYKIRFYLLARFTAKNLKFLSSFSAFLLYCFFNIFPYFFTKLFTKRTRIKNILRRIGYNKILR